MSEPPGVHATELTLPFIDPIGGYDRIRQGKWGVTYMLGDTPHRLDGPSIRFANGGYLWRQSGLPHRADGPARYHRLIRTSGDKYRHRRPSRSRASSPAQVDQRNDASQWCETRQLHGFVHCVDGPAVRWQDGSEEWFQRSQRHRSAGPAVVGADGLMEWHFHQPGLHEDDAEPYAGMYEHQLNDNYFRDYGPSVILPDHTRYWGSSTHSRDGVGGYEEQMPAVGPWVEYVDGSVDWVLDGKVFRLDEDHRSVVQLRRAGRDLVKRAFADPPELASSHTSFLPWLDSDDHFEESWRNFPIEPRYQFAHWAVSQWGRVIGLASHEDERRLRRWIGRFKLVIGEQREEVRLWREDMKGYLKVALRRLEAQPDRDLPDLQKGLDQVGIPLTGAEAALTPESRLLRVVVTAPSLQDAVPENLTPQHVGSPLVTPKPRTAKSRNSLYVSGMAECALAALAVIVRCKGAHLADTILLNMMVDDVDTATGLDKRYCIFSVQVEREAFGALNLDRVDPLECVKRLGGVVPRGSEELAPVRPLLEFDREDARIIGATEVAAHLGSRANLMELTPTEFEALIQNLFTKIGLETHQTQASRDGGVDAIAYDSRPIFGGKIIIQAKRYKNTVGVSAVRDLYGTVLNEGAGKGLLVTTSGYGKSSYEFAKNKPLELLEGGHLLHLLKEHLGIEATIVPPDTWVDPTQDEREPTPT